MALEGKTALVTGATGFLGGALTLRLAAEGVQVRAMARTAEKAMFLRNTANIKIAKGDVTDAERMLKLAQGCNYVFHIAVSYGDWEQQHAVNFEGTRNVMQAATEAKADHFIFVSSIAAYGYSRTGLITEMDALMPVQGEQYNLTKIKAETVIREIGAQTRLAYNIIRPGMIYGPGSGQWTEQMFKLAKRRPIIWIGDGSGSTFPVHVDDVVDLMLVLVQHPSANREVFNCVHPDPVTWREFLMAYSKLIEGENAKWLGIPAGIVSGFASLIAALAPASSRVKAAPEVLQAILRKNTTIDMTKAREQLGWQPKIDLKTGIETCIPYLREKGLLT
jgi:nucleoside-diphosphate-sugar epimerase